MEEAKSLLASSKFGSSKGKKKRSREVEETELYKGNFYSRQRRGRERTTNKILGVRFSGRQTGERQRKMKTN